MKTHQYQFPIASERLIYKHLGNKDIKAWEAFFIDNPSLSFVGINSAESPEKESKKWIERQVKRYDATGVGILGAYLKQTGELIGNCGLIFRENILAEDGYEIGYSVIPKYGGQGFAKEMASCFRAYFEKHELAHKVYSIIDVDNIASQKVAEFNGMQKGSQFNFQGAECYQFYIQYLNH